jgi:hypothetical protein
MTDHEFAAAVAEGLSRCQKSTAPLICLAEYILKLRDADRWKPTDAEKVGREILKLLRQGQQ